MKLKDIHPAALKEIERAMKNDLKKREQAATCSEKGNLHEKSNTKKATEEVSQRSFAGDRGWDDRSRAPGRALDRIGDPDQRETQRDVRGG